MGFAEQRALIDGEVAFMESRARTLVRAGGMSQIESLVGSAGGQFGGPTNLFEQGRSSGKAREAYQRVRNWVYAATNCIAKRIAGQPWCAGHYEPPGTEERKPGSRGSKQASLVRHMRRDPLRKFAQSRKLYSGADIEQDEGHLSLWLLDEPNHLQDKFALIYMAVMNLLVTGEWFFIGGVTGRGKGEKLEIWAVPSAWIVPDHGKGSFSGYKLLTGSGNSVPIPRENVCRGYFPDPSDIKGCMSPLSACMRAAQIDEYILGSQAASFERGINPNVCIIIGENPTGKATEKIRPRLEGHQRRQILRAIRHIWSQTVNSGDPAILDGLIGDIKKLQLTPAEMDWKQSGDVVKARILQTFGVNEYILGSVVPGSYAQANAAEMNFVNNICNPIIESISVAVTKFLSQFYEDGDTLAVWLEPCAAKDEDREMRRIAQLRKHEDITQDEHREWAGFGPAEEIDEPEANQLLNPQLLDKLTALQSQVAAGAIPREDAIASAILILRVTKKQAEELFSEPPEPEPMPTMPPGGPPIGQQPPGTPPAQPGGPQPPPEPPAAEEPPADGEPAKGIKYNPDQPRDELGRFGEGGGGSADSGGSRAGDEHSYGGHESSGVKVDAIGQVKLTKPKTHDEAITQLKSMNKIMDAALKDMDDGLPKASLRLQHVKAQLARAMGFGEKLLKSKGAAETLRKLIDELIAKFDVQPDETDGDDPEIDTDAPDKAQICAIEFAGLIAHKSLNGKIARTLVKQLKRRQIERVQRNTAKQLAPFFAKAQAAILKDIGAFEPDQENAEKQAAKLVKRADMKRLDTELRKTIAQPLADAFIEGAGAERRLAKAVERLRKFAQSDQKDFEGWDEDVDFAVRLPEWLEAAAQAFLDDTFSEDYWTAVNLTTRDHIEVQLRNGISRGWSTQDIVATIREGAPEYSKSRATNVARTEVTGSMSAGAQAAMVEAGADAREWLSVLGSTTRDDHAEADGQQQPMGEPFTVGGEQGMFPGDVTFSPAQRCGCQCSLVSAFVGEGLSDDDAEKSLKDFREEDHPRDEHGRFGEGGAQGDAAATETAKPTKPKTNFGGVDKSAPPGETKKWINEWSHYNSPEIHQESRAWVETGAKTGDFSKHLDELYQDTQSKLSSAGIEQVKVFRGIVLDANHPLAKALNKSTLDTPESERIHKLGDEVEIDGATIASWSMSKKEAGAFAAAAGRGKVGVVFERIANASDIVTAHGIHTGFRFPNEKEVVCKQQGTQKYRLVKTTLTVY